MAHEQRPECGQCLHGKFCCAYTISPQTDVPIIAARAPSVGAALLNELSSTPYHRGVDPLELLNHFFQTSDPLWMGSAVCQSILQQYTPQLALGYSFLLLAMLAFSAYHIAVSCSEQQRYKMSAACHYSVALQSYRQAIDDESV